MERLRSQAVQAQEDGNTHGERHRHDPCRSCYHRATLRQAPATLLDRGLRGPGGMIRLSVSTGLSGTFHAFIVTTTSSNAWVAPASASTGVSFSPQRLSGSPMQSSPHAVLGEGPEGRGGLCVGNLLNVLTHHKEPTDWCHPIVACLFMGRRILGPGSDTPSFQTSHFIVS
jgi:hypothetical protein